MKLIEKTRIGSKVTKKYDKPKTPYQRILTSVTASEEVKEKLKRIYEELNPFELKKRIDRIKSELERAYTRKARKEERNMQPKDEKLLNDFSLTQSNSYIIYVRHPNNISYRKLCKATRDC
jgi:hypothetical protein